MFGLQKTRIVLGKLSGRHAFKERIKELGYELSEEEFERAFEEFKHIADKKKEVFDEDIEAIVGVEKNGRTQYLPSWKALVSVVGLMRYLPQG